MLLCVKCLQRECDRFGCRRGGGAALETGILWRQEVPVDGTFRTNCEDPFCERRECLSIEVGVNWLQHRKFLSVRRRRFSSTYTVGLLLGISAIALK